jgi:CO/xanthine dehydrogenase FAD-binding subunit
VEIPAGRVGVARPLVTAPRSGSEPGNWPESLSVTVLAPARLDDAVAALAADPSLTVLAGGTDLMVAVNYGQLRPGRVLSLRRVPELHDWHLEGEGHDAQAVLGAATPGRA